MNPIAHLLTSWLIAEAVPNLDRRDRVIVTLAGVVPDLDGLGVLAESATRGSAHPLLWWSEYHHVLGHSLGFAVVVFCGASALAHRRLLVATLAFAAVHVHFVEDLVGSRGPDGSFWEIPYLWPFSDHWRWSVPWQWELNSWPNLVVGSALLFGVLALARVRGSSPLGLVWPRADQKVVAALRHRFPLPRQASTSDGTSPGRRREGSGV